MGHSREQVLVALDVEAMSLGRAEVRVDGAPVPPLKVLGLVPLTAALVQTQAGLVTGSWLSRRSPDGQVWTDHPLRSGVPWAVETVPGGRVLVQRGPLRVLRVHLTDVGDGRRELSALEVRDRHDDVPLCRVDFAPFLPDLRAPFEGRFEGRWVLDVHGQRGHAMGRVEAVGEGERAEVLVHPDSPRWVLDRPLRSRVSREGRAWRTVVEVVR